MSGRKFKDFSSSLKELEGKAEIVEIANQVSPSQVVKPDLEDDQKRWLIAGICLHKIVSPALRQYIPPVVNALYNVLKQANKIDQQAYGSHVKRYKPTNKNLNYEAINNNSALPKVQGKTDVKNFDYNIGNGVDFTKLFLLTSMAHYSGFDDTCDSSALLNIIINIDKFPPIVQNVAKKILDDMRNPWAHCNFSEWDVIKYQNSFQMMQQLIRNLQLPQRDETFVLSQLHHWQTNGIHFLNGTTLGLELVKELRKETEALSKYSLGLASKTGESFSEIHQALQSMDVSLVQATNRITLLEQETETMKTDMKSLGSKVGGLQKEHTDSLEHTQREFQSVKSYMNDSKLKLEETTAKVENIEANVDDIRLDLKETNTGLKNTNDELKNTRSSVDETKTDLIEIKKNLHCTRENINTTQSELHEAIADITANKNAIEEMKKYLSPFRPSDKMFFYPPDRISTFVSREDELEQLQNEFYETESEHHLQIICGLGGIGKTTLAIEYSWTFQAFYPGGIFWMSAETNEALEDSLRRLALDTYMDSKDANETIMKTLNWLSRLQERWLLVIDNVDMAEIRGTIKDVLFGTWKRISKGHILITSRRSAKEAGEEFQVQHTDCITLDAFSVTASINFLMIRSGIQQSMLDETPELLAKELGGLPLALEQAAAHIRSLKCTFKEYLEKFHRKRLKLLKKSRSSLHISKERLAVQTTWQLNFDYIAQQSEEEGLGNTAVTIMEIAAFLYADEIPLLLFNIGSPEVSDDDLLETFQDKLGAKQITEILVRFSLFQLSSDGALTVHRLVQEVIRENLTVLDRKAMILQCATRMVNKALGDTQSPKDALKEENIGRASLQMWSKIALNANTLKSYLLDFTKSCERHKEICFNVETSKLLQASAIYHSLFQRQEDALACQDQMLSIISATDVSEPDYRDLTCIKIPLLAKDRQTIQSSMAMVVTSDFVAERDKDALLDSETLRLAGNDAFKVTKYQDAIQYYSEAIAACQGKADSRIFANRSLAYLKILDFESALRDADQSIQLDPKAFKAYSWKAYAIAHLIRLGQLPKSWESAGLAAASVAGYLNNQCLLEYKMKIEYPVVRYRIINNEYDLGGEMSSLMNMTYTTLLLRKGSFTISLENGQCTTKSIQIIGIEDDVEVHSPPGVALVKPYSSRYKFEDEIKVYFENVTFPDKTGQIVVGTSVNAVFYRCKFSNGKKGCENFPYCKGREGCVNSNPNECRVVSIINEKKSCPQSSGVVGYPGICAMDGANVLIDSCILDRCGGGGTLSIDGSLLVIKSCVVRNMRQMGVEARNEGRVIADRCTIYNNQFHGVAIGPKGKGEIRNCIIYNNKEGAWCGGNLSTIGNSRFKTTSDSEGGSTCIITGNLIYQNCMSGLSLDGGSYDISGNRIFENWLWGMMVRSRSTANICDNDIFDNKCGGIRVGINYSSTVFIDGNTIRDHTGPAFYAVQHERLRPGHIQVSELESLKAFGMLDDESTSYTLRAIVTTRNVIENNNKGQQHPRQIHNLVETCCFCRKASSRLLRCSKCRKASYCSEECLSVHWKRHKNICKLIEKNFTVEIMMSQTTNWDEYLPKKPGRVVIRGRNAALPGLGKGKPPDRNSAKRFIVKIQSGTEYTKYDPHKEMRLYDQTQSLDIHFRNPGICNLVYECGVLAATTFTTKKIFCWAAFKDNGKVLCIYTENLPPFQTW